MPLGCLVFPRLLLSKNKVVLNVVGVTVSLAWFMLVVMGWAVGVLEILGLIVFVGYSGEAQGPSWERANFLAPGCVSACVGCIS